MSSVADTCNEPFPSLSPPNFSTCMVDSSMHLCRYPMVPLCTAFSKAGEDGLATCSATQKCGRVYPQCSPHTMEGKSLWINVPTSLSFSGTILSSNQLIITYFIVFLPFLSLSLYFPHFCFL